MAQRVKTGITKPDSLNLVPRTSGKERTASRKCLLTSTGMPWWLHEYIHMQVNQHVEFLKLREKSESQIRGIQDQINMTREEPHHKTTLNTVRGKHQLTYKGTHCQLYKHGKTAHILPANRHTPQRCLPKPAEWLFYRKRRETVAGRKGNPVQCWQQQKLHRKERWYVHIWRK